MTRREMLSRTAGMLAGLAVAEQLAAAEPVKWQTSMCDWMMGRFDPSVFELGKKIGLNAVQVSIGFPEDNLQLRRPEVRKKYLEAAKAGGLGINSVAMGLLNDVPLAREPKTALWVADAIATAKALGAKNVLLAFFGNGELKEDNTDDMRRVAELLAELAPRAEKAQVILGIESYLTAEAHLKIIDQVKSKYVQVYYDPFNANDAGHDYLKEIKLLGGNRICEVHFKEGGQNLGNGKMKWPEVAGLLKEIGYRGYLTLETASPSKDVVADAKKNLEYLKRLFA